MENFEHHTIERSYGLTYIVKKLFIVCLGLVAILFFIQTAKLATVGRMGSEISNLEQMEAQMKLENEVLRSEISELRSSEKVKNSVKADESLSIVNVNIIPSAKDINDQTGVIASE